MQLTYPIHKKFVGWAYLPNAGSYPDQSSDLSVCIHFICYFTSNLIKILPTLRKIFRLKFQMSLPKIIKPFVQV